MSEIPKVCPFAEKAKKAAWDDVVAQKQESPNKLSARSVKECSVSDCPVRAIAELSPIKRSLTSEQSEFENPATTLQGKIAGGKLFKTITLERNCKKYLAH
jgi:hypothetical protein